MSNSLDCSPPGSSVHGILQARILDWVAISSSRGSSWPRDWTLISCVVFCIRRRILFFFLTTEPSRSYRKVSFLLSTQDFFHFTNKMNQSQEDGSRILKLKRTLSKYFVLFPYLYASASKIPNMKPGRSFSEDLQEGEFPIVNSKMKAGMCNLGRSLASHGCSPSLLTTP